MIRNRVREFRKQRKMTLEKLAELTGLSVSYLSRIEANQRGWTVDSLAEIARALSVPPAELIDASRAWVDVPVFGVVGDRSLVRQLVNGNRDSQQIVRVPAALGDVLALTVNGNTQYPRYSEGDIIAVTEDAAEPDTCLDRECLITLDNGQYILKTLHRGTEPGKYHLMTHNEPPVPDRDVTACRPVIYVGRAH